MLVLLVTLVGMLATDNRPTTVAALPELDAAGASATLPQDLRPIVLQALQRDASAEYGVWADGEGYAGTNEAHGLHVVHPAAGGVDVMPLDGSAGWTTGLRLAGLAAAGNALGLPSATSIDATGNRVETLYADGSGPVISEWYVHGPLGVEQGFTVHRAMEADQLEVTVGVVGALRAVQAEAGRAVLVVASDRIAAYFPRA
jgi:hypothetical protein